MRPCISHHHACDCREHRVAVLNKAAQDAACELDALKNVASISPDERARIQGIVERVYNACEPLGEEHF